jgi:pyruvate carboxylase
MLVRGETIQQFLRDFFLRQYGVRQVAVKAIGDLAYSVCHYLAGGTHADGSTPQLENRPRLALFADMCGLSRADVESPEVDVAFPESVVSFFKGDLGQPYGGFPPALQAKILAGQAPLEGRPGATLPPVDLDSERRKLELKIDRPVSDAEFASWLMYPKVFTDYAQTQREYGDLTGMPTAAFFYGVQSGQELNVELGRGRSLVLRYLGTSDHHDDNHRTVFFELNGQPRAIKVGDGKRTQARAPQIKAERDNPRHLGAPMPGVITQIGVKVGDRVNRGDTLMTLEAMKMQTAIRAESEGLIKVLSVHVGQQVDAKDLLAEIEPIS